MDKDKFDDELNKILNNKEFAKELEAIKPGITGEIAGYLLHSWLPKGYIRKIIMVLILVIACIGAFIYSKTSFLLLLLILPLFSPRIMGETAYFLGVVSRFFKDIKK